MTAAAANVPPIQVAACFEVEAVVLSGIEAQAITTVRQVNEAAWTA